MCKTRRDDCSTNTGPIDVEQQLILRLPEQAANNLRKDLQNGTLKDKLSIEIHPELRRGKVVYDGQMVNAKLYDLPCIVESYKTTDKKNFYKTADVSQILVCTTDFEEENAVVEEETSKKKDKKFNWMNGLCPPFKCVRRRRFRKIVHKKNPEQPDIDRELRRLFATDAQAIELKWEVLEGEEEPHHSSTTNQSKSKPLGGLKEEPADSSYNRDLLAATNNSENTPYLSMADEDASMADDGLMEKEGHVNSNDHIDIFGDVSSSDDEGGLDASTSREEKAPVNAEDHPQDDSFEAF